MSTGWLVREPASVGNLVGKYVIDRNKFPTRYEEYSFVLRTLTREFPRAGFAIDAASGFNAEIHLLGNALNDVGWTVLGVDANPASLQLPGGQRITRVVEDITLGWSTRGIEADCWLCVSTLEELNPIAQLVVMEVAFASLRAGGLAIVTADAVAPNRLAGIMRFAGFEVGPVQPVVGEHLCPRVSFAVGKKPR